MGQQFECSSIINVGCYGRPIALGIDERTPIFFSIIIIIIKTFKYRFTNASLNLNKSSIIIYIVVGLECFTADFYDQKYLYLYTLSIINTAADADGIE